MVKYLLAAGALVLAGVPAAVGLSGNASFDRDVPVRVPEQARTVAPSPTPSGSVDDDGTPDQGPGDFGATEPGDDHGRHGRHHDGDDDRDDDGSHHRRGHDDDRSGHH